MVVLLSHFQILVDVTKYYRSASPRTNEWDRIVCFGLSRRICIRHAEIIKFNILSDFEKVTNCEKYFFRKSFFIWSNFNEIVYEGFYNTQVRNCLFVTRVRILSSKSGSNSNLKFIIFVWDTCQN